MLNHSFARAAAMFHYVDQKFLDVLICPICHDPLVEPRRPAACRHAFCQSCLQDIGRRAENKTCPICRKVIFPGEFCEVDETLKTLLDDLQVYCGNKASGCDWVGPRSNFREHLARTCHKHRCRQHARGCLWLGTQAAEQDHGKTCGYVEDVCVHVLEGCNVRMERRLRETHLPECVVTKRRQEEEERRRVAEEERKKRIAAQLALVNPLPKDVVKLDVGGRMLVSTKQTLCKERGSILEDLFSGSYELRCDTAGVCYLDRNGDAFALVLDWLRSDRVRASLTPVERELLGEEAKFWQLSRLVQALESVAKVPQSGNFSTPVPPPTLDSGSGLRYFNGGSPGSGMLRIQKFIY